MKPFHITGCVLHSAGVRPWNASARYGVDAIVRSATCLGPSRLPVRQAPRQFACGGLPHHCDDVVLESLFRRRVCRARCQPLSVVLTQTLEFLVDGPCSCVGVRAAALSTLPANAFRPRVGTAALSCPTGRAGTDARLRSRSRPVYAVAHDGADGRSRLRLEVVPVDAWRRAAYRDRRAAAPIRGPAREERRRRAAAPPRRAQRQR